MYACMYVYLSGKSLLEFRSSSGLDPSSYTTEVLIHTHTHTYILYIFTLLFNLNMYADEYADDADSGIPAQGGYSIWETRS